VPDFQQLAGPGILIHNGNSWTLDLGAVQQGQHLGVLKFASANDGSFAIADLLAGSLEAAGSGFTATLGAPFAGLASGSILNNVEVSADTSTLGTHTETITLHSSESNVTGFSAALPDQVLTITEKVVPEAQFGLSPSTIDFGTVRQGQLSVPLSITNTANRPRNGARCSVSSVSGPLFGQGQWLGCNPGKLTAPISFSRCNPAPPAMSQDRRR